MLRQLHSLPGLIAAVFAILLGVTGAILSLDPALERVNTSIPATGTLSVAELTAKLALHYPEAEQVVRSPSGTLIVYFNRDGQVGIDQVDPLTGTRIAAYQPSGFSRWIKNLHRSLLLDTTGRALVGITALLMILLAVSGAILLATRMGGWRQLLQPVRGTLSQRLHIDFARVAIVGLLLSALTGAYLSAGTFELISEGVEADPELPLEVAKGGPAAIETLAVLKTTDFNDLRELIYPYPNDPAGMYSMTTEQGAGYIDQVSGSWLSYQPHDATHAFYEFMYMLHTGEGLWWLGLLLGLAALSVPLLAVTGTIIWWKRQSSKPKFANNSSANSADSVILVGSESNTTWAFAKTLHDALVQAGHRVHSAPMNQLASHYRAAQRLLILTATYGDGDAPTSAKQFLKRLEKITQQPTFATAILGFGERQYPNFCGFAKQVESALNAKGWPQLLPLDTINRQSPQEFNRWGHSLGTALGAELNLLHTPVRPKTTTLELVERADYGIAVQAPTAVLRFKLPAEQHSSTVLKRLFKRSGMPYFEAGDLVGIFPPDSPIARFYSLASASTDGTLEICVRQHRGGVCSNFLYTLPIGGRIEVFIQPNANFRPAIGKAPIVLIGAGTGIGPLVGFIRHNQTQRPMYLYWGGRSPESDFLYEPELNAYLKDQRLTELNAVFSRSGERAYVQDKVALDAEKLRKLIEGNAQILVCGGRDMANSVSAAIKLIIAPLGIDLASLKAQGRYLEDVY